ncbi:MAG TPA: SCO family protein [Bryobacteraceae bacterium]|nr:SCO family protein [Bryobacteraceae bacterium]
MKCYGAAILIALSLGLPGFAQPGMPANMPASTPSQVNAPSKTSYKPAILRGVGIDQKMGAQVPLDLQFLDESDRQVKLGQYFGKPVILALVYYSCPSLCDMVLDGTVRAVGGLKATAGKDYEVVAVSFDPRETPQMAREKKATIVKEYNRPGSENGWHFLTGEEGASKSLAEAVGFHYSYDSMSNQYLHAAAIMLLTPEGKVSRYFYGIAFEPRDVRLGLDEASGGRIGSLTDAVLLYCSHYDPATGKYGVVIMNVLRLAGFLTVLALASFMIVTLRRDFAHRGTTG